MNLFARLKSSWVFSASASAVGFGTTLLTVHLAGPSKFAEFTIDNAKLGLVVLLFELVPSPFALFQVQKDAQLQEDLASFSLLGGLGAMSIVSVCAAIGVFSGFSIWMLPYAVYIGLQRYLDLKLQAAGRLPEYFQLTFAANLIRVLLIPILFFSLPHADSLDLLWAALATGSLASIAIWTARRPGEVQPFFNHDHLASLGRLLRGRRSYYPYYLNVALKRVRDAAVPVLCGAVVADKVEIARYLLAFRGLDFVLGQLRVAEAVLNNFAARHALKARRAFEFGVLAILGQIAAFLASILLGAQAELDPKTVITAALASLLVYPYVAELVYRSDAYAAVQPFRVTLSLSLYVLAATGVLMGLYAADLLSAPTLVLAPLTGQSIAAASYLIWRRFRPAPEPRAD